MTKVKNSIFVLILGLGTWVQGQIVINEYSASNLNQYQDNYQRTEDWIELYNTSDQDFDLSGFHLSDKDNKPMKWVIPSGTMIPAKGYLTFWCSGRDEVSANNYHTNFKLSQTSGKDEIVFTNPEGQIIESTEMIVTLTESSVGKNMDGEGGWMVYTDPTLGSSNNAATKYIGYTKAPEMSLAAGFYSGSQTVSITNNEPNSVLRYTIDGTNPKTTSAEYSGAITIDKTTVIKAQSFSNDGNILTGKMDFNTYLIDEDFTVAVYSVAADSVIDLANGQGAVIPIGSIEYFNKNKEREATSFGSLNRHGQDSWVLDHRSLDWVSRDEMGYSKAVEAPLFANSKRDSYQKFMFRNSGDDNYPSLTNGVRDANHVGSTHIRDEYVQALAKLGGMKLDIRAVERVVLFLNGEYWGLYGMRERPVDHDYTDEYYGQGKYDLHYLTTWGTTEAQYGREAAFEDWYQLRDFILDKDMSNEANYDTVKDQLNTTSLIDYMVANLNTVAADWLNYNTGWWRGLDPKGDHKKWGYILWDLDATFDYYINYTMVPNVGPDAKACDIDSISVAMDDFFGGGGGVINDPSMCASITGGSSPYPATDSIFVQVINMDGYCCQNWDGLCQDIYDGIVANGGGTTTQNGFVDIPGNVGKHEKIFLKLIEESPEFKQLYYSRYADLMNTVYSCENMLEVLDSMVATIAPEMPRQIDRWGGTVAEWESNVDELKQFIQTRCAFLDDGLKECYALEGPFELTIMSRPEGAGEIKLNTLKHETLPWTGTYFGAMDNIVKAKATDDDLPFSHWESKNGQVVITNSSEKETMVQLNASDTLIAVFGTTTSIQNIDEKIELKVFPNPTVGTVNIAFELDESAQTEISIQNLIGQTVARVVRSESRPAGKYNHSVDMAEMGLSNGMYLIEISVNQKKATQKLIYLSE